MLEEDEFDRMAGTTGLYCDWDADALAAVLGVVIPIIGATIPFIEIGEEADTGCARLLAEAGDAG